MNPETPENPSTTTEEASIAAEQSPPLPQPPQSPQSLQHSPLHLLRRALQSYTARWVATIGDVTPAQYAVLLTVFNHPGVSQTVLGELTAIDLATLVPLANRLEQRGLLNRAVDPANRRRKQLTLTEKGVGTIKRLHPLSDEVDEAVLGAMPLAQRAALLDALRWISEPGRQQP
ncbi:MarR family winged helix-turn-helix transcriptional regulator [Streptomyces sp. NPDC058470]|uniref:MarR family winged helix-turn-helix transcriptional regulator n=1 Tax=Streptomyces sp. NPDC058470 TaxID=3346515 RepID=UPI00364DF0A1